MVVVFGVCGDFAHRQNLLLLPQKHLENTMITHQIHTLCLLCKYVAVVALYSATSYYTFECTRAPFRARINLSHFGADINYLIYLVKLFSKFRGGAKKQPVPWPGGPG